jgi:hypothetical protein
MVLGAADKLRNVVFGLYRHAVKCSAIVNQAGFCWLRRPLAFSLSVNTADRFATRTENLRATRCRRGNAVASSRRQLLLEATMALVDYIEMFSEPAPPTADDRPAQSCQIRAASNCHETPCTNGMMRSECRDPHNQRARVASGVARDGVPLSRRDETSFPRVRSIARIPRLGVAAATLSWVCRYADLPLVPDARCSRGRRAFISPSSSTASSSSRRGCTC